MNAHIYRPLDPKRSEIRVLTLLPSSKPIDPIHCSLKHVSLDDKPQFEALSYVWGPPNPKHDIFLDGAKFTVTPSLHAALTALRHRKKPRIVWADAICINQNDDDDKAYQVPLMGRLYTEATRTVIWFGASNDDIDALVAWLDTHGPDRKLLSGLKMGAKNLFSDKAARDKDLMMLKAASGFFDVLTMRYWYRMWTFQEFVLPKDDPLCYCGTLEFRMEALNETSDRILDAVSEVRQRVQAEVAAAGENVDNDESLIVWMETVARYTTALGHKSAKAQSLGSVFALRKEFRAQTRSLAWYMGMTSERECFLGHDRFYALYGVMPALKDVIPVNYKTSILEVTLKVSSYVINVEEIQAIYSTFGLLPGHLQSQNEYPSWVPDFARGSDETDSPERYHTKERLPRTMYLKAVEQAPRANVEDLVTLRAYGRKAGVVAQTRTLPTRLEDIFAALHDLFSGKGLTSSAPRWQKLSALDRTERLAAAAASDISFLHSEYGRGRASNMRETVELVCKAYAAGENPQYPKPWTKIRVHTHIEYLAGRTVFVTENGLLGLGVSHIEHGDIVTVLNREGLPIVLRQGPGETGTHRLVGTAYVDGLMDNEWLDENAIAEISRQVPTSFCIQ